MSKSKAYFLTENFFQKLNKKERKNFFKLAKNYKNIVKIIFSICNLLLIFVLFALYFFNKKDCKEINNFVKVQKNINNIDMLFDLSSKIDKYTQWYNKLFLFSLKSEDLDFIINRKMQEKVSNEYSYHFEILIHKKLSYYERKQDWVNIFKTLRVYLMLAKKEPFDLEVVRNWYKRNLIELDDIHLVNKLNNILKNLSSEFFTSFEPNADLCSSIFDQINSFSFSEIIYSYIQRNLSRSSLKFDSVFVKKLDGILNQKTLNSTIKYIYTKSGYQEFNDLKKELLNVVSCISYLKIDKHIFDLYNVIESVEMLFFEDYNYYWTNFFNKIRFISSDNIISYHQNLRNISLNFYQVFNFFSKMEKDYLISSSGNLKNISNKVQDIVKVDKINDYLDTNNNDYKIINLDQFKKSYEMMREDVKVMEKMLNKIITTGKIEESCFNQLNVIDSEDSVIKKVLINSKVLNVFLAKMQENLIVNLKNIIIKNASCHINSLWKNQVLFYYRKKILLKYPFNVANYQLQVNLSDFIEFFSPIGILSQFRQKYLSSSKVVLHDYTKELFKTVDKFQSLWFDKDNQLKIVFLIKSITKNYMIKEFEIDILGKKIKSTKQAVLLEFSNDNLSGFTKINVRKNAKKEQIYFQGDWGWYKFMKIDDKNRNFNHQDININVNTCLGKINLVLHFNDKFISLSQMNNAIVRTITSQVVK